MPSERFNNFLPFIFEHECVFAKGHYGDYSHVIPENVDGDSGGVTKWGIDKGGHPFLSVEQIKNLTQEQATEIYSKEWERQDVEHYAFPLGEAFFNCAVNCGLSRAIKILSKAKDGAGFIEEQEAFYRRLVEQRPSLGKFLKGWLNRTADLKNFLKL